MKDASPPAAAPAGGRSWWDRLRPRRRRSVEGSRPGDPLRTGGQLLREAREAKGLSLRDLAQRTRISIAVLEALERGWKERLPEATYLRAMLPLLEKQLDLHPGSLEAVLPHDAFRARGPGWAGVQAASPPLLQGLARWQSSLLYVGLLLGLLYGVNLQQQRLAALGRLAASPIPLTPSESGGTKRQGAGFADLQPLGRAAGGQALDLLRRESQSSTADLSLGILRLNLARPTQLDLRSARGGTTQLSGVEGDLSLPVLPPFELRLSPGASPGAVRWNGKVLTATAASQASEPSGNGAGKGKEGPGIYVIPGAAGPPSAAPSPAKP